MAKTGKHPGGRPTKYRKELCEQAYKLCLLGATDARIADLWGVSERVLHYWKHRHPEFLHALKNGREGADAEIAKALYHRAKGYSHKAVKIITVSEGGNQGSRVEKVPYIEHYPPDTAAAFIWLKNRAGWRDKQEHQIDASKELQELLGWVGARNGGDHSDDDAQD